MRIRSVVQISREQALSPFGALIVACGYEHRSQGVASLFPRVAGLRYALCFREFPDAIARHDNENFFRKRGFALREVSSNDPALVQKIIDSSIKALPEEDAHLIVDISTMTRTWHGAIVHQLRMADYGKPISTTFAYVPSMFRMPPKLTVANEFVGPVDGFAALSTPELPVAAIIGLGYERGGALGLQQLLDPARTILFKPNDGGNDRYHSQIIKSNREILERTLLDDQFDYQLLEPGATFAGLASLVGGLRHTYRVVLTSLGPKVFGLISFLLATQFNDVSVWRVSSGIHGKPRDAMPDIDRAVFLKVTWAPESAFDSL
jgi:hypothetical protein